MAFKIKDNLDLYGNQLLNFALQSDSGFPQSPQVGHIFNYTGTGVMANHAVMCVDETTKAFKALAFVDEIATNAEFVELKEKVDLLIGDDVDTDTIIDSWKEVQAFLADIEDTKTLQGMLSSYLPLSGGTIRGSVIISGNGDTNVPLNIATPSMGNTGYIRFGAAFSTNELGHLGFSAKGVPAMMYEGTVNPLIHSGNIGEQSVKSLIGQNCDSLSNAVRDGFFYASSASDMPSSTSSRACGITLRHAGMGYIYQLAFDGAANLYARRKASNWQPWKTIAFTDSTVAAATRLEDGSGKYIAYVDTNNSRFYIGDNINSTTDMYLLGKNIQLRYGTSGTTGLLLNSSGNVTIGGSDLAGTDAKLYIDNNLRANSIQINTTYTTGLNRATLALNPNLTTGAGYGVAHIFGAALSKNNAGNIVFRNIGGDGSAENFVSLGVYGNDNILCCNGNGNVLIGTTEDITNNYKLQALGKVAILPHSKGLADFSLVMNSTTKESYTLSARGTENGKPLRLYYTADMSAWKQIVDFLPNGNVLIGTTTDNGAKLQVSNDVTIRRTIASNHWDAVTLHNSGSWGQHVDYIGGICVTDGHDTVGRFGITYSNNVGGAFVIRDLYGGAGEVFKISALGGAVITGDTHITGNLIVDGEVSAGGAGQEGESGDGGAEVIDKELAKGQSSYTIPNTIGRSAVAVSLYEWNANNGSWDMCLADIAVKDATITVTFGSATSVNHKLVAVG